MSPNCVLSPTVVEVVSAEFPVFDVVALDVVRDFEDLVRDGHGRLLVPGMSQDAAIARLKGGVLGAGDGERAFHQGMAQVRVAFASAARSPFAGTFVLPWAETSPTAQIPGARNPAHVPAGLGDDRRRC